VQVWRAPPIAVARGVPGVSEAGTGASPDRLADASAKAAVMFRQGFLSAATNPKGILFFAAFLPQFVDARRGVWLQFVLMAGTFVLIEFVVEYLLASLAQRITAWLARVGRGFNRACGGVFIAIGALLPLRP
jgi:threonine/homoserine/homoserine lactone efflux protein